METEITVNSPVLRSDEPMPWHRPQVQQLVINLGTNEGGGSFEDRDEGAAQETFPSDRRLKKDISALRDALEGVLALDGVRFSYDASRYPEMGLSKDPQIGFIAQELERVYPELVTTKDNGFKAVNYAQLVPVLVEAIKEQQSMIADLQEQVNELQHASKVAAR